MTVSAVLERWPEAVSFFAQRQMLCAGCYVASIDTMTDVARNYHLPVDSFLNDLRAFLHLEMAQLNDPPRFSPGGEMEKPYTWIPSLGSTVEQVPTDSIVSRTFMRDDRVKAILFAFAPGQELSEHTASMPAIIQILEGTCTLTLGSDAFEAGPGAWAYMQPNLPHSLLAHSPVKMLLLMLPNPE